MATTEQDYAAIEAARNKAAALTQQAGEQMAGVSTFRDEVMNRVRDARAARGMDTLSQDLGNATTDLSLGRAQIRERMGTVVNPLTVDAVGDKQRSYALGNLASISNIMKERSGTLEEAIQGGANTLQAGALKTKAQADAAAIELQSLMEVVKQKQAEAAQQLDEQYRRDKMAEETRQFNVSEANKKSASGGGLPLVPTTPTPSPKPSSKPTSTPGRPTAKSSGGLTPPPMSATAGRVVEYPPGSGVMWTSTGGGWK